MGNERSKYYNNMIYKVNRCQKNNTTYFRFTSLPFHVYVYMYVPVLGGSHCVRKLQKNKNKRVSKELKKKKKKQELFN